MAVHEEPRLIVALDQTTPDDALAFLKQCDPTLCRVKIGNILFTHAGTAFVEQVRAAGFDVFLDLKYHDIPNTVAQSVLRAAALGVWMVNVHCLGGSEMLQAARRALDSCSEKPPLLIGVSILTSHTALTLQQLGLIGSLEENVLRLAKSAQASGLDGLVCSAQEAPLLRQACGEDFCLVCPGVRLAATVAEDDQKRIVTPKQALQNGADYLVIGRPITQAVDPYAVLTEIAQAMRDTA